MLSSSERAVLQLLLEDSLGEEVIGYMQDPRVTDLVINPDETVHIKRSGTWLDTGIRRPASFTHAAVMTTGTLTGVVVDQDQPRLAVQVPRFHWRMQAMIEPAVAAATIVLRQPAKEVYSLASYVDTGRLSKGHYDVLVQAVRKGHTVVLAGSTGSGKTTVLSAMLEEVRTSCPDDRVLVLEDTSEIRCNVRNKTEILVRAPLTMADTVETSLRMIPTRIVIGELRRGAETAAFLRAANTGHKGGFTSVHAGSARAALLQLEDYVSEVPGAGLRRAQIARSVHLVVFVEDCHVVSIVQVHEDLDARGEYQLKEVVG